jgi:hypothetical protein
MRPVRNPRGSRGLVTVLVVLLLAAFAVAFLFFGAMGHPSKLVDASTADAASFRKLGDALARFVMLNRRLPCPASGTAHTGAEDPQASATDFTQGTTTCNSPSGVVPWQVLGLSQADALDPWGRYVSYRVFDGATGFTRTNGISVGDCINESTLTGYSTGSCATTHENTLGDFFSGKGITVNDFGTANTGIAYVLISMGETGNGAYYPGASAPNTMPSGSSKEFLNAGSAGTYWTLAASSPQTDALDANHFDDALSYATAFDVATAAKSARPWPLQVSLEPTTSQCTPPPAACSNVSFSSDNSNQTSLKFWTDNANGHGAAVATAAADTSRVICDVTGSFNGISPCTTSASGGGDDLDTSNNETLTFDFKVRRAVAMVKLAGMQHTGGSDEQAQITFYDSSGNPVGSPLTKISCHNGSGAIGQYLVTPTIANAEFTKVEVKALNKTTGGSSDFAVAAIAACYPSGATCQVPSYSTADDCP